MNTLSFVITLFSLLVVLSRSHGLPKDGRTCGAHTKSEELMHESEEYRVAHELQVTKSRAFVTKMKKNKDRAFNKRVKTTKRGLLYSEYDDEIATEPVIHIPIVWHILYDNDNHNLGDTQLESQITVLNEDFRATNTEIENGEVDSIWSDRVGDSKIEFYTNTTNRVQISDAATVCLNQTLMKFTENGGSSAQDPKYFLNVWVCDISSEGLLGYAYQPCLIDTIYEPYDGLVLGSDNVGSIDHDDGSFYFGGSTYNLGRTATHEIGHWLNLDHTWGTSESCSVDDDVSDTPTTLAPNYGCPADTTDSCDTTDPETGTDLRDMYENYMDYSDDACMFIFTEEQVWRMRSVVSGGGCHREMYYAGAVLESGETLQPSSQRTTAGTFSCNDGCPITEDYLNDNWCDCSECEDEDDWTCGTCSTAGCPSTCGGFTQCDGSGTGTGGTETSGSDSDSDSSSSSGGSDTGSGGVRGEMSGLLLCLSVVVMYLWQ